VRAQGAAIEQRLRSEEAESRARALAARRRLDQARLETERYSGLAMEDCAHGLANRRQLDERCRADARCAQVRLGRHRGARDVDHFKGINDRFSHAVGDEVLRCVGEILRAHCRLGDLAGRYGGEEFMLVFRNLEMRAARRDLRARAPRGRGVGLEVDPSAAARDAVDGARLQQLVRRPQALLDAADHWLYEAKHHGRNQIQPLVVAPA
jgi:diguanylate cyclase (GGDEF)-like protein